MEARWSEGAYRFQGMLQVRKCMLRVAGLAVQGWPMVAADVEDAVHHPCWVAAEEAGRVCTMHGLSVAAVEAAMWCD